MEKNQSRFLNACRRLPVDATPVWFMRQAGRYMAEYRAIRKKLTLLEIVQRPEVAAEVTLQPVEAHGVDAAILFADILLPVVPLGFNLEFVTGKGPQIDNPFRKETDLKRMRDIEAQSDLGHVMETIQLLREELSPEVPLIGFSGAPFTVASYVIEGGPSKEYHHVKTLMYSRPDLWNNFLAKVTEALTDYLLAQIDAGAQAVQVFDSWVGVLNPADYQEFVQPHSRKILQAAAAKGVPVIHFGTNTTTLLPLMKQAGGDVIGLDWRIPLDEGWKIIGKDKGVQGNLDPLALFAPRDVLSRKVRDVLDRAEGKSGHIFNLGHGISHHTDPGQVKAVVDMVHEWTSR